MCVFRNCCARSQQKLTPRPPHKKREAIDIEKHCVGPPVIFVIIESIENQFRAVFFLSSMNVPSSTLYIQCCMRAGIMEFH